MTTDLDQAIASPCFICLFVSGKMNSKEITLSADKIAANQKGVAGLNHETKPGSDNFPPKYGPIINPKPNAAAHKTKIFRSINRLGKVSN